MRPHIDAHLSGQLLGDIPPDWLRGLGFSCQCVLTLRFNGRCPSCCLRMATLRPEGAPSIWNVFTSGKRVRTSVPAGARDAWSRCLIMALADVIAHRDARFWTDLLTLPALVLTPRPSRSPPRE